MLAFSLFVSLSLFLFMLCYVLCSYMPVLKLFCRVVSRVDLTLRCFCFEVIVVIFILYFLFSKLCVCFFILFCFLYVDSRSVSMSLFFVFFLNICTDSMSGVAISI